VGRWGAELALARISGAVGIGLATIISMPYALLANALPPERMGFFMGVFNLFIVLPQILAATVLGSVVSRLLGGGAMLIAALLISRVPKEAATNDA
jgi:maltose/moltooligosaccharide transporter